MKTKPWTALLFALPLLLPACEGASGDTGWQKQGAITAEGKPFKYMIIHGVTFIHDEDGWRYAQQTARVPRRGEKSEPEEPETYYGPFRDPDELARDFAATLGAQYAGLGRFSLPGWMESGMLDDDMRAMLDSIDAHMAALEQSLK